MASKRRGFQAPDISGVLAALFDTASQVTSPLAAHPTPQPQPIYTQVSSGGGGAPPNVKTPGGVEQWLREAMRIAGVGDDWLPYLKARAMQESSGNPLAINNWDSNARRGTPSKGLMQTIEPTFNRHKVAGYNDIWNPVHNSIAAINYIKSRYGHPSKLPKGGY